MFRKKSFRCPFCLNVFKKKDVNFDDIDKASYYLCPNKEENYLRPACNKKLPNLYLDSVAKVVSITGPNSVGKTHFLYSLIGLITENKQLRNKFGIRGELIGDLEAIGKFQREFTKFKETGIIKSTEKKAGQLPFVIKISYVKPPLKKPIYLTFFDNSGEIMSDQKMRTEYLNYSPSITLADAHLFFFEPRNLKHFKEEIENKLGYSKNYPLKDHYTSLELIIEAIQHAKKYSVTPKNMVLDLIRNIKAHAVFKNEKIRSPFGLVMLKCDQIDERLPPIPSDVIDSAEFLNFNSIDYKLHTDTVQNQIISPFGEDEYFLNLANQNLANYSFLAAQTIEVDDKGDAIYLKPRGVLFTFLWLLKELKLIKL